jgi:hypothetical protein
MPKRRSPSRRRRPVCAPMPPAPAAPAAPPAPAVRVRMFRQGLGDCFLITFDPGGDERHVLIDCGTLGATTTGMKIADVVAEIRKATGDRLDLLVATHEHTDHLSGFGSQQDQFKQMTVERVWLAWTENPRDDRAKELQKYKGDLGVALAEARSALAAAARLGDKRCEACGLAVRDLSEFAGTHVSEGSPLAARLNETMEFIRTGFGREAEYRDPAESPLEPSWLPGFRFYVLGPPRNQDRLKNVGSHGSSGIYSVAPGLRLGAEARAAAGGAAPAAAEEDVEREMPFGPRFRWPIDGEADARADFYGEYMGRAGEWRRVDAEWLDAVADAAQELALQLDSLTNNTSLALAIERIADGRVLLFPADAQEGNWLSWHDPEMKWTVTKPGGGTAGVTPADLLSRTVFYKVGHHASHNATAKAGGLELMPDKMLTAFIPVDRRVALGRHPKDSWQMPAKKLYRRLLEKCEGRVVRSDIGWAVPAAKAKYPETENEFVQLATAAEWKQWVKSQASAEKAGPTSVKISDGFIDFVLKEG